MDGSTHKSRLIYRLLEFEAGSAQIILLLFPPIYAIFMLALGKRLLEKQNKSSKLYEFFANATIICFVFAFVISPIVKFIIPDFNTSGDRFTPLVLFFFLFFLSSVFMLSRITVQYERLSRPDHHFNIANSPDYIVRFFTLLYWPFTIWVYQKRVNSYFK